MLILRLVSSHPWEAEVRIHSSISPQQHPECKDTCMQRKLHWNPCALVPAGCSSTEMLVCTLSIHSLPWGSLWTPRLTIQKCEVGTSGASLTQPSSPPPGNIFLGTTSLLVAAYHSCMCKNLSSRTLAALATLVSPVLAQGWPGLWPRCFALWVMGNS